MLCAARRFDAGPFVFLWGYVCEHGPDFKTAKLQAMRRGLSGPKVFKLVVRVDDEFLGRAVIEGFVTARCIV